MHRIEKISDVFPERSKQAIKGERPRFSLFSKKDYSFLLLVFQYVYAYLLLITKAAIIKPTINDEIAVTGRSKAPLLGGLVVLLAVMFSLGAVMFLIISVFGHGITT